MSVERRGAAIEIAHLNKVYGNGSAALVALDDINLRVAPGEFLCVVGPSGCGKSQEATARNSHGLPKSRALSACAMLHDPRVCAEGLRC